MTVNFNLLIGTWKCTPRNKRWIIQTYHWIQVPNLEEVIWHIFLLAAMALHGDYASEW